MRKRKEIMEDLYTQVKGLNTAEYRAEVYYQMQLEVLLDIRDLLQNPPTNSRIPVINQVNTT